MSSVPNARLLLSYSATHSLFAICVRDFLQLPIKNWRYNRPVDKPRSREIRMHEEFQGIIDMYRDHTTSQKHKGDIIAMMIQLLTEVPKWKVPAAPSLVQDSATLQKIVQSAGQFFDEILRLPHVKPLPAKVTGLKGNNKKKDKSKQTELEERLAAIDAATMNFLKM